MSSIGGSDGAVSCSDGMFEATSGSGSAMLCLMLLGLDVGDVVDGFKFEIKKIVQGHVE